MLCWCSVIVTTATFLCSVSCGVRTRFEMLLMDEPGQVEDPGSHCEHIPAATKRAAGSTRTSRPCPPSAGLLVPAAAAGEALGQAPRQGSSSSWDLLSLGEGQACTCVNTVRNRKRGRRGVQRNQISLCVIAYSQHCCSFSCPARWSLSKPGALSHVDK